MHLHLIYGIKHEGYKIPVLLSCVAHRFLLSKLVVLKNVSKPAISYIWLIHIRIISIKLKSFHYTASFTQVCTFSHISVQCHIVCWSLRMHCKRTYSLLWIAFYNPNLHYFILKEFLSAVAESRMCQNTNPIVNP